MNDITISNLRNLIAGINCRVPLPGGGYINEINFDNAATTPPFKGVIQEINNFAPLYSSIHRGTGYKSRFSTEIYEKSRNVILNFVNANPDKDTVIFVKNTTEAINKLANRLLGSSKKNVILTTSMEHHSNDLPWREKYIVDYIDLDDKGRLRLDDLEKKLKKHKNKVMLVTLTGASNVTGFKNNIAKAAELSHKYNAMIHVDGAQLIPHAQFYKDTGTPNTSIDFLSFSAHKMYAPFGTGVLIGPKSVFEKGCPDYTGGGTVKLVTHDTVIWDSPPQKDEAGTPNLMGVVALVEAIKILNSIGMDNLETREKRMISYATVALKEIDDVIIYGDCEDIHDKVGIIPFNIDGMPHEIVSTVLSFEAGIAVRSGCFCAQPYIQRLLNLKKDEINKYIKSNSKTRPGMVRISFGLYNTCREVDVLVKALKHICKNKEHYLNKYSYLIK